MSAVAFLLCPPAFATGVDEVRPSQAEMDSINRQIAAIQNPQDRAAVQNQSLVWKLTTFLCQSAARPPLEKLGAGDRFFLQDDKPDSQELVSPSLLKGRGQFRQAANAMNWTAFHWACHLDPATAAVTSFEATPLTSSAQAPACQANHLNMALDDRNGAFDGMSQSGTVVTLKNTGSEACTMPSVPTVQFADDKGHLLSVFRRTTVQARRPGPHGSKPMQHVVPVVLAPGAVREVTLHWVSGDVFDDSHHCVGPARLVLKVGQGEIWETFKGQICAPARSSQVFDQSPLEAHTDAQ